MVGKIAYALLFCLLLPLGLALWALTLDAKLPRLPLLAPQPGGILLVLAGLALMVAAMVDLWRRGGGLPMNAFPPPRLVREGMYRWVPHPIYFGFGMVVPGAALLAGSAAGLLLVTPFVWLAMVSLVLGYERIDLNRRFGQSAPAPWLWLPPPSAEPPQAGQKLATALLVFVPWFIFYQAIALLGVSSLATDTHTPAERSLPIWEWAAFFYLGAYLWVALAPWCARTQLQLRLWVREAWCGSTLIFWCFLVFPLVALPRAFDPQSFWGHAIVFDRNWDTAACAFPSFHVFWSLMAARLWQNRIGAIPAFTLAALIAASCVLVGNHSVADIVAAVAVFLLAIHCESLWLWLLRLCQRIANSWRDWRFGRLRIINHGGYAGLAVLLGLWTVGLLGGSSQSVAIATVALCSLAGAGLWGQWLEASSALSRPFGYFGGLFGGLAGIVLAQILWGNGWLMLGSFAVAAPLIQSVGRLRCLVQGCCHGRRTPANVDGIRYTRPLSRVVKIAHLADIPVYPTPLYSILANAAIFGILLRLWFERLDYGFIAGTYLLLSTCARFVEEAYRGEPQTARLYGLAIYQWLAIGCLLVGMCLLACPAGAAPAWQGWSWQPLVYAIPLGLLSWFAMGVDFPESSKRMSSLA